MICHTSWLSGLTTHKDFAWLKACAPPQFPTPVFTRVHLPRLFGTINICSQCVVRLTCNSSHFPPPYESAFARLPSLEFEVNADVLHAP
jgi:hypothetical protein